MSAESIYWLKAIHEAIKSFAASNQSDWNEADETAGSFIKNKPVVPSVTIIEGTEATGEFTPASGAPTFSEALALVTAGNFVLLKYEDSGDDVYEYVIAASDDAMATKNLTWSAE